MRYHGNIVRRAAACAALAFASVFAAHAADGAFELSPAVAELAAKAKVEGQVSVFVSTDPRSGEDEAKIEAAIKRDFGIGIDVRLVSGAPDPIFIQQLAQEHKAGVKPKVDLIVSVPNLLATLGSAGALAEVDWVALGAPAEEVAADLHAVFTAEFARPVIYNTNAVEAGKAPRSLEELVDEKWAGKIVTAGLPDVFAPWAIGLGEKGALHLVERLYGDLNVGLAPVPTGIRTLVESGEYAMGFGIRISREQTAHDAPVAYAPLKAPVVPRLSAVLAASDH